MVARAASGLIIGGSILGALALLDHVSGLLPVLHLALYAGAVGLLALIVGAVLLACSPSSAGTRG
jgi:hypothetical protein